VRAAHPPLNDSRMGHRIKTPRRRGRAAEAGVARSVLLRLRLMPSEWQLLRAASAAANTTVPRFSRRVITEAARAALRELARRLRRAEREQEPAGTEANISVARGGQP